MTTITIANQKGGVGKTTTAAALSAGLTRKGFKVLVIDSDNQGNLTASIGIDPDSVPGLSEVFDKTHRIEDVIIKTSLGDVVPCSIALSNADHKYVTLNSHRMLKKAIADYEGIYDFCIIDAPPALGIISINDLVAADFLIIPINAAAFSIQGMKALVEIIKELREDANPKLEIMGILVTRYNSRTVLNREMMAALEEIAASINTVIFDAKIRQSVVVEVAQVDQMDIFSAAEKSPVARDYAAFVEEIINKVELSYKE